MGRGLQCPGATAALVRPRSVHVGTVLSVWNVRTYLRLPSLAILAAQSPALSSSSGLGLSCWPGCAGLCECVCADLTAQVLSKSLTPMTRLPGATIKSFS